MYQYHFLYVSAQNYKIKSKADTIFVIQSTNRIICTYFRKTVEGGVIPGEIVKDLAR